MYICKYIYLHLHILLYTSMKVYIFNIKLAAQVYTKNSENIYSVALTKDLRISTRLPFQKD